MASSQGGGGGGRGGGGRGPKPKTKVLVRNLPWNLLEDTFREALQEWEGTYDHFAYFPGRRNPSGYTNSLAYLNFKSVDDLFLFRGKFDGRAFAASKKTELRCHVEYAPYQKIPKQGRRKPDSRTGTLESDPAFNKWLEELNAPVPTLPSAEEQLQQRLAEATDNTEEKPVTTPLLEHMKQKYMTREAKSRAAKAKRPRNVREIQKKKPAGGKDPNMPPQKGGKPPSRSSQEKGDIHLKKEQKGRAQHHEPKQITLMKNDHRQNKPTQKGPQGGGGGAGGAPGGGAGGPNKPKMNRDTMIMLRKQLETASKEPASSLPPSSSSSSSPSPYSASSTNVPGMYKVDFGPTGGKGSGRGGRYGGGGRRGRGSREY